MARYRRYFPVCHQINHDPEVQELVRQFGSAGLQVWLELLSISDQRDNHIKISPEWLKSLCKLVNCRQKTLSQILSFYIVRGWVDATQVLCRSLVDFNKDFVNVLPGAMSLPKYAEYHRTVTRNGDEMGTNGEPMVADFMGRVSSLSSKDPNLKIVASKKEKPVSPGLIDFEKFWQAYPRKTGKGAAEKSWQKIAPRNGVVETILSAVLAQKQSSQWTKDDGNFIPHPSTWLNQRRWEDEVEVKVEKRKVPMKEWL